MGKKKDKKKVSPNADSEARRTSTVSRWSIYCRMQPALTESLLEGIDEVLNFEVSGLDNGSFLTEGLSIERHSNWVYPWKLKILGGYLYLTAFEARDLLTQFDQIVKREHQPMDDGKDKKA